MTPKWGQNLPDASPTTHPQRDAERKKKPVRGKFLRGVSSWRRTPLRCEPNSIEASDTISYHAVA